MIQIDALAIRAAVNSGDLRAAEHQLALIGDTVGDDQLALVVKDLTPGEVMTLVGEGDYSKPSLVVHFISAEQFLGALVRIGAKWGRIGDKDDYGRFLGELTDLFLSVLLVIEPQKRRELLTALIEHTLGMRSLICVAISVKEYLLDYDSRAAEHGTVGELMTFLEDVDYDAFVTIQKKIASMCLENAEVHLAEEGEESISEKRCRWYQRRTLNALVDAAMRLVESKQPEAPKDEIFGDV